MPTWGELVQGLARGVYSGVGRPVAVWVDAAGMRDVRVTSLTPIDIGEGQSPWNPQELLAATGVALVVSPAGALLTNRDSLGSLIKRASGLPFRNVVSVADESELSETWPEWSRPVAAGTWATATPLSQSPWSYPLESQLLDLPATGWHNYRMPIGSSNASRLTIYQLRYVELLGYVLLVGVAGIAAAFLRRRTRWMLLAIGCFIAVTLLCPLEWVPVARGVLLGLALGLTWTAVQRIPRLSRPRRSLRIKYRHPAFYSWPRGNSRASTAVGFCSRSGGPVSILRGSDRDSDPCPPVCRAATGGNRRRKGRTARHSGDSSHPFAGSPRPAESGTLCTGFAGGRPGATDGWLRLHAACLL